MNEMDSDILRQIVRGNYAKVARGSCGCETGPSACCGSQQNGTDAVNLLMGYSTEELDGVIKGANLGLGCGNPTAIGNLKPGETVLDLGSGGGFDCFLAGKKVGEKGRVIGVDMTPEMLARARENVKKMKSTNVEFRLGEIEHLPVADNSVDVIISNCVINLSPEKDQVFRDAFRVLKPGGRLAVSDMVATAEMPRKVREQAALLTKCIAGAENVERVRELLSEAGFEEIKINLKRYSRELVSGWHLEGGAENYVASADIEAIKPLRSKE